jgi:hypothetical protein
MRSASASTRTLQRRRGKSPTSSNAIGRRRSPPPHSPSRPLYYLMAFEEVGHTGGAAGRGIWQPRGPSGAVRAREPSGRALPLTGASAPMSRTGRVNGRRVADY